MKIIKNERKLFLIFGIYFKIIHTIYFEESKLNNNKPKEPPEQWRKNSHRGQKLLRFKATQSWKSLNESYLRFGQFNCNILYFYVPIKFRCFELCFCIRIHVKFCRGWYWLKNLHKMGRHKICFICPYLWKTVNNYENTVTLKVKKNHQKYIFKNIKKKSSPKTT